MPSTSLSIYFPLDHIWRHTRTECQAIQSSDVLPAQREPRRPAGRLPQPSQSPVRAQSEPRQVDHYVCVCVRVCGRQTGLMAGARRPQQQRYLENFVQFIINCTRAAYLRFIKCLLHIYPPNWFDWTLSQKCMWNAEGTPQPQIVAFFPLFAVLLVREGKMVNWHVVGR